MKTTKRGFIIGNVAGHHFNGNSDMSLAYHATRIDSGGKVTHGYFVRRKWLENRAAFNYDPTMDWAYEHWFEWLEESGRGQA